MEQLGITEVSYQSVAKEMCTLPLNDTILQTDISSLYDQSYCVTRHSENCHIIKINHEKQSSLQAEVVCSWQNEAELKPSYAIMSPYLVGECVLTTDDGSIYIWSAEGGHTKVYKDNARFPCSIPYYSSHYASHPRLLIVQNRTGASLVDIRSNHSAIDLFALPNYDVLHQRETLRLSTTVQSRPFYCIVATEYSWLLMDERVPNRPVLHLNHMLQSPPYFLKVINVSSVDRDDMLLLSSHLSRETLCYQFNVWSSQPVSRSSAWRVCQTEDFASIALSSLPIYPGVFKSRLKVPLSGMTAIRQPSTSDFIVFQGTVNGDVFSQHYSLTDMQRDKTCASGPGSSGVTLSANSMTYSADWLNEAMDLLHPVISRSDKIQYQCFDVTSTFQALQKNIAPSLTCHLCSTVTYNASNNDNEDDAVGWLNSQQSAQNFRSLSPNSNNRICYRCGHEAQFTKNFKHCVSQDVIQTGCQPIKLPEVLLSVKAELFNDATSKLLIKLWQGVDCNDLQELVVQREKELTSQRAESVTLGISKNTNETNTDEDESDSIAESAAITMSPSQMPLLRSNEVKPFLSPSDNNRERYDSSAIETNEVAVTFKRQRRLSATSSVLSRASSLQSLISASPGFLASPRRSKQHTATVRSRSTSPAFDHSPNMFHWLSSFSQQDRATMSDDYARLSERKKDENSLLVNSTGVTHNSPRSSLAPGIKRPLKRKNFITGF